MCDAYIEMRAGLERVTAQQRAMLAARPQRPNATWFTQNVSIIIPIFEGGARLSRIYTIGVTGS